MQSLFITVQGFDFIYIYKTIQKIQQILAFFEIRNISIFNVPSTKKKYTVERSPHIDKKSREQFEIKKYKTILTLKINNNITLQLISFILKNSIYPGIQISFSTEFRSYIA